MTPQDMDETPGVFFMLVEHESHCPGAQGDGVHCCCKPSVRMADSDEFLASMRRAQAASRAAKDAAARVVAKASKKGAA